MNEQQAKEISEKINLLEQQLAQPGINWRHLGMKALTVIVLFIIGTQVIRLIRSLVRRGLERKKAGKSQIYFIDMGVKILLYIVLVLSLAGTLGVQTTSFVALLGSIGIGVGLALQGSLSDLASGILLMTLRSFQSGDLVYLDSLNNDRLYVEEIRFFNTTFLTLTNYHVIIPNSQLVKAKVYNVSKSPHVRFEITFSVEYDTDFQLMRSTIEQVLAQEDKILHDLGYQISVTNLGDSGIDILIRAYVKNTDQLMMKFLMTEKIKDALDEAGVGFPYPQIVIHQKDPSKPFPPEQPSAKEAAPLSGE